MEKGLKQPLFVYKIHWLYFISTTNLQNSLALISEPVFAKRQLFNDIYLALI